MEWEYGMGTEIGQEFSSTKSVKDLVDRASEINVLEFLFWILIRVDMWWNVAEWKKNVNGMWELQRLKILMYSRLKHTYRCIYTLSQVQVWELEGKTHHD